MLAEEFWKQLLRRWRRSDRLSWFLSHCGGQLEAECYQRGLKRSSKSVEWFLGEFL